LRVKKSAPSDIGTMMLFVRSGPRGYISRDWALAD